jgi:hypothetical protein
MPMADVSSAPAYFRLVGIASVTSCYTRQASLLTNSAAVPRYEVPLSPARGHEVKTLFVTTPMQFPPAAPFQKRPSAFLPSTPHQSYVPELNGGPLHHTVLPSLSGWLRISRPPSFPPAVDVLGSHDLGSWRRNLRSRATRPAKARATRNRLTCVRAFGC